MKVLFISEYYPPLIFGGGEINLEIIAKALSKKGIDVSLLTAHFPGAVDAEKTAGITIFRRLKTGRNPQDLKSNLLRRYILPRSIMKETKRLIREHGSFDIIHCHGAAMIAMPELRKITRHLVATVESYPAVCPKGDRFYKGKEECRIKCSLSKFVSCQRECHEIGKMKNKWYLKYNPLFLALTYGYYKKLQAALQDCHIIAISTYVQRLLAWHGLESTVIPNALEIEKFQNREKGNTQRKKTRILFVGSLISAKGPQILLEALRGLKCHLDMYGTGPLKNNLLEKIRAYQLDATIHDPVPAAEMPQIYAQSDLVVFPSLWPEPFGRISIEALAAGTPVIASKIGGITEVVTPDTGILVPPGSVSALKNALQRILADPKRGQKLAQKGQEQIAKMYGEETIARTMANLYQEIINAR